MTTSSGLMRFNSYENSLDAIDELITRRQAQGMWITVQSMLGSYVVPGTKTWETVVTDELDKLTLLTEKS